MDYLENIALREAKCKKIDKDSSYYDVLVNAQGTCIMKRWASDQFMKPEEWYTAKDGSKWRLGNGDIEQARMTKTINEYNK